MSKVQNLPVSLKAIDRFLASFQSQDLDEARAASQELIAALKEAKAALAEGYNRKELTVCVGRIGFVAPADVNRLIAGEIPRLTVYFKKKDNHHMPLYYKDKPRFYKDNAPGKTPVKPKAKAKKPTRVVKKVK